MSDCTWDPSLECKSDCTSGCFAEKVTSLQVSPQVSGHNAVPPRTGDNAWERGIPTDSRGMPFLDSGLHPVGIKEFSEKRRTFQEGKRRLENDPNVFTGA